MSCPSLHRQVVLSDGVPVRVDWYDLVANPPRLLDPAAPADAALIKSATCCEPPKRYTVVERCHLVAEKPVALLSQLDLETMTFTGLMVDPLTGTNYDISTAPLAPDQCACKSCCPKETTAEQPVRG